MNKEDISIIQEITRIQSLPLETRDKDQSDYFLCNSGPAREGDEPGSGQVGSGEEGIGGRSKLEGKCEIKIAQAAAGAINMAVYTWFQLSRCASSN